ncbi:MAG: hypothetical protein CSA44_03230 [Gammaproteobacteria bacterium]|nr:MAG: hypothetical protein CSA44_03230 [Gammaproteobacteria bacterium]
MGKKDRQYDEDGLVIRINKEAEKRQRAAIKNFVKVLLKLANDKYLDLPIDERLRLALIEGKRLTGNAHKRHLSFLVRLVHEQGYDTIRSAYEQIHYAFRNDPTKIHYTERYRDRLLDGDKMVIDELLATFAEVDVQYVRQLARNAKKEKTNELKRLREQAEKNGLLFDEHKPVTVTKSSKLLYQYLFKLELRAKCKN